MMLGVRSWRLVECCWSYGSDSQAITADGNISIWAGNSNTAKDKPVPMPHSISHPDPKLDYVWSCRVAGPGRRCCIERPSPRTWGVCQAFVEDVLTVLGRQWSGDEFRRTHAADRLRIYVPKAWRVLLLLRM